MTYSRPATGTVSVRGPGDRSPRTQVVDNTGGVRASANARLIDASSAQIAGQNAGQDGRQRGRRGHERRHPGLVREGRVGVVPPNVC